FLSPASEAMPSSVKGLSLRSRSRNCENTDNLGLARLHSAQRNCFRPDQEASLSISLSSTSIFELKCQLKARRSTEVSEARASNTPVLSSLPAPGFQMRPGRKSRGGGGGP